MEKELQRQRKERKLEQLLRKRHCRPLVKLFKLQSTEALKLQDDGSVDGESLKNFF